MQTLSFTSGRHSACSGGQAKLVWDVLPARPKRAESLQQHTGLLLLAGIGASLAQTTQSLATKKERESVAAAASPATGSGAAAKPLAPVAGTWTSAASQAASGTAQSSSIDVPANVAEAREWIAAFRARPAPASAAPSSFALPASEIVEAEVEAADELVEKISIAAPEAVAAAAAAVKESGIAAPKSIAQAKAMEASSTAESSDVWPNLEDLAAQTEAAQAAAAGASEGSAQESKTGGSNPLEALLAWLKAIWAAILKFFEDMQSKGKGKGSGAAA